MPEVSIPEKEMKISVAAGTGLMDALKQAGVYPDAPCGGNGLCGKCKVLVNGRQVLACQTTLEEDLTVELPRMAQLQILQQGICAEQAAPEKEGCLLAFDIGTTCVVCFLLDGKTGQELAKSSMGNPQIGFGADVLSRIRAAMQGELPQLTDLIRNGMTVLVQQVCETAGVSPSEIRMVCAVGNPAMQQLFLGMDPKNLAAVPFAPVLTEAKTVPCGEILPICPNGRLQIIPNVSGYVGADTIGCLLATALYRQQVMTLLVDIGTNGEMVLGNRDRMVACAAAAGPALEGANIRFGMRGTEGAIDHVWLEKGKIRYSVIGGGEAKGICGSGLVDAVAVGLKTGLLNRRGRIQNDSHVFHLTEGVYLTQEDIRQVQLAKGAIHAGIVLMAKQLGLTLADIQKVQLAGAFGSFLNPENACRIGLLPEELLDKIEAVGNAAGSGAKMLVRDEKLLPLTQELVEKITFLELAGLPDFPKTFAKSMLFREEGI